MTGKVVHAQLNGNFIAKESYEFSSSLTGADVPWLLVPLH
jgi:hypothetical protein